MPSTNFGRSARVRETTKGVTPGNPAYQYMTGTAFGLVANDTFGRSEAINANRRITEHLRLGTAVSGSFATELSGGWTDWLLELALFDDFAGFPEAYNVTSDQNVTNIDSGTQTVTAAGAWVPGMIVEVSGTGVAGNNKQFKAQASSGSGTIIAPAATFTTTQAAPPAGCRALARGVEGAVGDLVTAAGSITSTSLNFTLFPIQPYSQVLIQGYDDATVDVLATVTTVAANTLGLTDLPANWTAGLGAGKTVKLYFAELATDEDAVLTESHKQWNTKSSPISYETFKGVAVNTLTLPFELNSIIKPTCGLVGFAGGVSESLESGATFADPRIGVTKRPIRTGSQILRLAESSAPSATQPCAQRLSLTLNNNLQPSGCLTSDSPLDWNEGDFEGAIDVDFKYTDKRYLEKYHAGTATSMLMAAMRGGWGYSFRAHNGVFTGARADVAGRNQEHLVRMKFEMDEDPTTGKTISFGRFRKYL